MSRLHPLKLRVVLRVLSEEGFVFERQSGTSHAIYVHPDGRTATVPTWPELPPVFLNRLAREIGIPRERFAEA